MGLKIKQFGCRRTCTNVVNVWLSGAIGMPILTNNFGWKHGLASASSFLGGTFSGFGFLISIKDPYAWVQSFAKWCDVILDVDFARMAVADWNQKYANWLSVLKLRVVIPIEKLLVDSDAILANVCKTFGVSARWGPGVYKLPRQTIEPCETIGCGQFDRERYLTRSYMSEIPAAVRAVVSEEINWDLIREFGYERE